MKRLGILPATVLLAVAVATIAAVVAALVSLPLIRGNAEALATAELSRLADLTATALRVDPQGRYVLPPRVAGVLQAEQVTAYVVGPGAEELPEGVTTDEVAAVTTGSGVEAQAETSAGTVLVVGRPFEPGFGVILVQPLSVAGGTATELIARLLIALVIGLAIAVAIALVAGAWLTTPLRRAADAALRLGRGERGIHVRPEGPAEVADMAEALNRLAAALAVSEGRQREFLLSVSHELRTPLTVIKGYVELLSKNQISDVTKTAEYYGRVSHEIERMQSLINDLLLIAELEDQTPIAPEIINFSREVAHLSNDLKTLQPMRPIETRIEPGILVNISHNYAQQMLANLFANLRRHTPEDSKVLIILAKAGNKALLTISDAGPGLPEEVYKSGIQYFQRFDRSRSRESGGSGLGMTIMKRIIENANGSIELRKSQFGGLEIEINLPISRD